ncbi:MFS transporter [Gymnopus androsaceus JB14]|uniref:MFS transporter n=1 Tax=Gymnopus androsaceus JB14 TaxID=1447944 RepID=A0A6A4HBR2_9AGAR|nr:MFS transporter [Gymnopus androsaceus JB14]
MADLKSKNAGLHATSDVNRIEAPVTVRAYLMCAFAAFGGIFFGYDSGYINGVTADLVFIHSIEGPNATLLTSPHNSLIVSILSAGTFFGALIAGDLAEWYGRRPTIIAGCFIYIIGVVIQICHTHGLGVIVAGRLVAGFGVGFVSAIIVLYMSEISPRKVRGAIVSGYQFCITIGLMLASCVAFATEKRTDTGSYRIPIGIQFAWGLILAIGLFLLPDSPRFYVKKGQLDRARHTLSLLRGQPGDSDYIEDELSEIVANLEYERALIPDTGYFGSWKHGPVSTFIFYFSTPFLASTGAISNTFLTSMIFTIINVCSTPLSFIAMEKVGRRPLLIWGALGMFICQIIVGAVGDTVGFNKIHTVGSSTVPNNIGAVNAQVAFIAIYIFFFAVCVFYILPTWGPAAWVVVGEIFPIQIRSRGVALSTASNWLWNTIIAVITPYMVGPNFGNLRSNVFWVWGSLCGCCFLYAYFLIPETKGLSLEQVDQMMAETTPRTSAAWRPTKTFAQEMGMTGDAHTHEDHHDEKV